MMYAGDEFYGDETTSGPIPDDDFDAERQAIQDEHDGKHEQAQADALSEALRDWER